MALFQDDEQVGLRDSLKLELQELCSPLSNAVSPPRIGVNAVMSGEIGLINAINGGYGGKSAAFEVAREILLVEDQKLQPAEDGMSSLPFLGRSFGRQTLAKAALKGCQDPFLRPFLFILWSYFTTFWLILSCFYHTFKHI